MRPLRILHISDLHERAPFKKMTTKRERTLAWDARQRGLVLGPTFDEALESLAVGGIDLVCFTGDLADWGQRAEYTKATRRIDAILKKVRVRPERFFAVPGNHDVQRNVNEQAWFGVRKWLDETHDVPRLGRWMLGVNGPPPGTKAQWLAEVYKRTEAFWKWFESYRGATLGSRRNTPLGYRETLLSGTLDGIDVPVHIVGLDSAWLCGADKARGAVVLKDRGSIALTEEQVEAHTRDGERGLDGLRIGLVHHPLDQLADQDQVRRLLGNGGVDILLHGHQHTPLLTLSADPDSELRILAAGCLIEGDLGKNWPNGFQLVELDPVSRSGSVDFRKWSESGKFWTKGTDIYRHAPEGFLRWSAPGPASVTAQIASVPAAVTLRMASLRLPDMSSITEAIQSHKRSWPKVIIEWPPSLNALVEGLKVGLQGRLSGPGAEDFAADVPLELEKAEQERRRVAHLIPALVERARDISDDLLAVALRNLLLTTAYRANKTLAFYASWEGLRPWQAPEEWAAIRVDAQRRGFAAMLGEVVRSGRLPIGRLITAEGVCLYDKHGSPGLYIWAPKRVLQHANEEEICRWFIPQLEYAWPGDLPAAYRLHDWSVDKIVE
jgi:predicted phosphodiesterase